MKRLITILACVLVAFTGRAQDDEEYQMEIGGGAGLDFYLGDANKTPFDHSSVMGGFLVRRMFNPRMALKADLAMGHLRGNTKGYYIPTNAGSQTPEGGVPVSFNFKRNVIDLGAQFEFNFWGYSMGEAYKGNSRITPYAVAGIGLTLVTGGGAGLNAALNCPIGVGVKYKLKKRLNIGAEWTFRFTTSDALDTSKAWKQLDHPYAIQSSGLKNKDCYSFLMLFLTYDIMAKCKTCHNND